jgi:hypothetical protein
VEQAFVNSLAAAAGVSNGSVSLVSFEAASLLQSASTVFAQSSILYHNRSANPTASEVMAALNATTLTVLFRSELANLAQSTSDAALASRVDSVFVSTFSINAHSLSPAAGPVDVGVASLSATKGGSTSVDSVTIPVVVIGSAIVIIGLLIYCVRRRDHRLMAEKMRQRERERSLIEMDLAGEWPDAVLQMEFASEWPDAAQPVTDWRSAIKDQKVAINVPLCGFDDPEVVRWPEGLLDADP